MKQTFLLITLATSFVTTVEARVWRPEGRRPISGDFREVVGNDVRIRTKRSNESVPYVDLSDEDRAYVRSQLERKGLDSEIERLDRLVSGGTPPQNAAEGQPTNGAEESPPSNGGEPGFFSGGGAGDQESSRTWTDINGNSLTAQFVRVVGSNVILVVNGQHQTFPLSGFSQADQQWLAENGANSGQPGIGAGNPANGGIGSMPSMPSGGYGSPPGFSGMGGSGYPGMPNVPGRPGGMNGMPGFPGAGGSAPSRPGGPGYPGAPGYPGMSGGIGDSSGGMHGAEGGSNGQSGMSGYPGGSMPGSGMSGGMDDGGFGSGMGGSTLPGAGPGMSGGPGFSPPAFDPPSYQPPVIEPPQIPDIQLPSWGRMNGDVLVCENCGAEFTGSSGLQEGDECPNCSGGPSFRGGSARGLVKLVVGLGLLGIAGISAFWKKISGG